MTTPKASTAGKINSTENKKNATLLNIRTDDDYDPYANRDVKHPTTSWETFFHFLKGSLGTGILAMADAYKKAGYLVGSIGTVLIGTLCLYCLNLLVQAEYEMCKRRKVPSMSFTGVAEAALQDGPKCCRKYAKAFAYVIDALLMTYQLGTCCVYVVFVSSNIKGIADLYVDKPVDVRLIMFVVLLPLILLNSIPHLKFLVPFSVVANVATMIAYAIILYYIFQQPLTFEGKVVVGELYNFPLFFGTVLFAMEAIGLLLPLENNMKNPKAYEGACGVLAKAIMIITFFFVVMGLFGYLRFGEDILGSITLNLPRNDVLSQLVQALMAFAIFISHGVQCFPVIEIVWMEYLEKHVKKHRILCEFVVRIFCVGITFLLAVAIPNIELFISLFGALCLSALGVGFPAMIQTCVYWEHTSGTEKTFMVVKNAIITFLALVVLVSGTATSLIEIIHNFFK